MLSKINNSNFRFSVVFIDEILGNLRVSFGFRIYLILLNVARFLHTNRKNLYSFSLVKPLYFLRDTILTLSRSSLFRKSLFFRDNLFEMHWKLVCSYCGVSTDAIIDIRNRSKFSISKMTFVDRGVNRDSALRVAPAVTRLTVYRRPYITRRAELGTYSPCLKSNS